MKAAFISCLLATGVVACDPLLDADFDELPAGALANGTVNLPGSPNGDQMLVSNGGGGISIEDGLFEQQHLRIPTGDPAPAVTFRPVEGDSDARIYISYAALLTGTAGGRIVFHNLDDNGDPDRVPDMTLDFLQEDAEVGEAPVTPTGWKMNGIVGEHSLVLSISPDGDQYEVTVVGDDVAGSGSTYFAFGSTDDGWRATPPNFELTLTTVPDRGSGSYQVDNLRITQN